MLRKLTAYRLFLCKLLKNVLEQKYEQEMRGTF